MLSIDKVPQATRVDGVVCETLVYGPSSSNLLKVVADVDYTESNRIQTTFYSEIPLVFFIPFDELLGHIVVTCLAVRLSVRHSH